MPTIQTDRRTDARTLHYASVGVKTGDDFRCKTDRELTVSRLSECVTELARESIGTKAATAVVRVLIAAVLTRSCQRRRHAPVGTVSKIDRLDVLER